MRGSDKANPRLDDQRKHETEGLTDGAPVMERDDANLQEAPTPGEPSSGARRPETAEPAGGARSFDESAELADLARWFAPSAFPSTVERLRAEAWAVNAPDDIVAALDAADPEARIGSATELFELLAGRGGG